VNFWLALAVERHVFHNIAIERFERAGPRSLVFCRVTQMGLLRLITNPRVMDDHPLSQGEAWDVYGQLRTDFRVAFARDHPRVEAAWRQLTHSALAGRNLWTASYLAAFAQSCRWRLTTFDRDFTKLPAELVDVEYLGGVREG